MSIFDQYQTVHEFDLDIDGVRYVGTVDVTYDIVPGEDDERGRPQPRFAFHPLGPVTLEFMDDDDGPGLLGDDDPRAIAIVAALHAGDVHGDLLDAHRFPEEGDDV
ncbi:hypothetical protein HNR00_003072 [Methylorubrum rhodinum]|uniref:Uncharacterized protein n=1 Tax=Methylorubrum rhodinum TaxID=29428 RepID=A0A840ZJT4_9HYPH|nr:hypothetical protein [Methylorubrum rhodinum]MBB5758352.1 hypothetical protein [Methylorubrum rhodinum]